MRPASLSQSDFLGDGIASNVHTQETSNFVFNFECHGTIDLELVDHFINVLLRTGIQESVVNVNKTNDCGGDEQTGIDVDLLLKSNQSPSD